MQTKYYPKTHAQSNNTLKLADITADKKDDKTYIIIGIMIVYRSLHIALLTDLKTLATCLRCKKIV